jgi:hypothetical protein
MNKYQQIDVFGCEPDTPNNGLKTKWLINGAGMGTILFIPIVPAAPKPIATGTNDTTGTTGAIDSTGSSLIHRAKRGVHTLISGQQLHARHLFKALFLLLVLCVFIYVMLPSSQIYR